MFRIKGAMEVISLLHRDLNWRNRPSDQLFDLSYRVLGTVQVLHHNIISIRAEQVERGFIVSTDLAKFLCE